MTLLARTEKQIDRDHRDGMIAAEFAAYRKAFPKASTSQIVRTIVKSQKFGMSEPGIKRVLYRTGAITPQIPLVAMTALIRDAVELGATLALERLGISSGEVSQRQARKVYGAYFDTLIRQGRVRPSHIEPGHAGTKFYRVADILACKVEDRTPAQLL